MNNVFKVLKFELLSVLNKKSVKVTTLVMCVVVLLATSIPTVIEMFSSDEPDGSDNDIGMIIDDLGFISQSESVTIDTLALFFGEELNVYTDENTLRDDVSRGVINNGYIIEDEKTIRSIVQNKGMFSSTDQMMISILQRIQRDKSLNELGIDPTVIDTISNTNITLHEEVLGKDAQSSF